MANNNPRAAEEVPVIDIAHQAVNNNVPVLKMPNEVLEKIAEALVWRPQERVTTTGVRGLTEADKSEIRDWKETLYSFRLACRAFSLLTTPRKDLFNTFYWLPTRFTMYRLREISNDCGIAPLVHKITFLQTYTGSSWEDAHYSQHIGDDWADSNFRHSRYAEDDWTGSNMQQQSYRRAANTSHNLALHMKKLPNVTHVAVTPTLTPQDYKDCLRSGFPVDLATPRHDALMDSTGGWGVQLGEDQAHHCYRETLQVRTVWNSIVGSGIRLEALTMKLCGNQCESCKSRWRSVNCEWLRTLHISTDGTIMHDWALKDESVKFFTQAISVAAQLEELWLSGGAVKEFGEVEFAKEGTRSWLPKLQVLKLSNCKFGLDAENQVRDLVLKFPQISSASFQNLCIKFEHGMVWYRLFDVLRSCSCSRVEFKNLMIAAVEMGTPRVVAISRTKTSNNDLQAFITNRSLWTEALDEIFYTSSVQGLDRDYTWAAKDSEEDVSDLDLGDGYDSGDDTEDVPESDADADGNDDNGVAA